MRADPSSSSSVVARLVTDEATARAIVDGVAASFDTLEAVASAQIDGPDRWAVAIHFRDPPNEAAVRALVALAAGQEPANPLAFSAVQTEDWVKTSLEGLSQVEAGRFFVHGAHDRARVPLNRIGIEIEAALAFGTGHHGTTRGCLIALDAIAKTSRPSRILDVGTGSAVLAIAAARALRQRVLASDIDAVAVKTAARMRASIAWARRLRWCARTGLLCVSFENAGHSISSSPISSWSRCSASRRRWRSWTAPGAHVVLSGLLPVQANAVLAAYRRHGLFLERRILIEGWVTLVLSRER